MAGELKVPSMGESITEVHVGQWYKREGDRFETDEDLVELETDKATVVVPAPYAGVLTKVLRKAGETAQVGDALAQLDEQAAQSTPASTNSPAPAAASPAPPPSSAAPASSTRGNDKGGTAAPSHVMPAARRALAESGINPAQVAPTGPGGRMLKEDVLRQAARTPPPPMPAAPSATGAGEGLREEETVPMSVIRRRIAERLVEAQHAAALLTTFNEVDVSAIQALRQKYKDAFQEKYGIKLGFMSFFVKATVEALRRIPQVNAEVRGTDVVYRKYYDIGIAVGGGKGLVVPVLRNAERMGFAEIELAIARFAKLAGENKLTLEQLQGGTFTISNGGVYGSLLSTPIVNPPQSGILGMHAIQDRAVVREGAIVARPMMYLALTYDHRIVDGREAVTFLKYIKELVEDPARLLLDV